MESKSRISPSKPSIKINRDSPYKGGKDNSNKQTQEVKTRDLNTPEVQRKNPETKEELIAAIQELQPIVEEKREKLKQLQEKSGEQENKETEENKETATE
ncbi:hypothetical protein TVAG_335380 [Trichomonas vaginalis G3]|uniref:Uncharacterized protein n=1 Tax=Trichomonas vaginalis (strain ATCC PRA-98 / G3) TaxID=412133 RepID=A2FC65_TRIV3|nr:hypothetical protein TVAGG3_0147690 [Trichomonas vaginalis G3]EAX97478.1 hypothetical protein TVAG_335380 [Trichomonas vaginalis G3]KAI5547047.1 hypothetical protein TVAGG3_0147690 [Trichomonas vaginalis G3]|eukprot:XP_001310408.1 hypothetical protein [Trichomonas vaginalis G3]